MVSVVHIFSDCKYLCLLHVFLIYTESSNIHSHQYDFNKLSLAGEIHFECIILSFSMQQQ